MIAPEPVAEWDFSEPAPPYHAKDGRFALHNGPGSSVRTVSGQRFGTAATFDGTTSFLRIPADDVGDLNVATRGDSVTVLAWARRTADHLGFVGGMWQEDDNDPRRQYGLFVDLGLYGGKDRVAGHVSASGGASPGLPYSRDCSASARMLDFDSWRMIGFTYDGHQAISYLDGIADARPHYTEPDPPYGNSSSYAKNPFIFDEGLNRGSVSDFTVGAVKLTRGMHNFFGGEIAWLAIYDVALSAEQVMHVHLDNLLPGAPLAILDFYRVNDTMVSYHGGSEDQDWPLELFGWTCNPANSYAGQRHEGVAFLARTFPAPLPATAIYDTIAGLPLAQVREISLSINTTHDSSITVLIRVGDRWFGKLVDMPAASEFNTISTECSGKWSPVSLTDDGDVQFTGTDRELPTGDLSAVGIHSAGTTGFRISNVKIWSTTK